MESYIVKILCVAVLGYLLGSVNSSLIVGRFYGIDVRNYGSGNAGTTNTLRTMGKTAALLVVVGDLLKGVIACLAGMYIIGDVPGIGNLGGMIGGTTAIFGHNWPLYFGFKGGKGALTSLAVAFLMDWRIGLILLAIFLVIVAVTRYVSLGSICGGLSFPVLSALPVFNKNLPFIIFAVVLAVSLVLMHRSNIGRILKGTESKFSIKK